RARDADAVRRGFLEQGQGMREVRVAKAAVGDAMAWIDAKRGPRVAAPGGELVEADRPAAGWHPVARRQVEARQRHAAAAPEPGAATQRAQPAKVRVEGGSADGFAFVQRLCAALAFQASAFEQAHGEPAVGKGTGDRDAGRSRTDDADVALIIVGCRWVEVVEDQEGSFMASHAADRAGTSRENAECLPQRTHARHRAVSLRAMAGRYPHSIFLPELVHGQGPHRL